MKFKTLALSCAVEMGENGQTAEWYRANHRTPWVATAIDQSQPWVLT